MAAAVMLPGVVIIDEVDVHVHVSWRSSAARNPAAPC